MAGIHARVAPSGLAAIMSCRAYVQMSDPYRNDPPTPEQLEGDAAHWVIANGGGEGALAVGGMTPQGVPIDEDMIYGAQLWHMATGLYGFIELPVVIERIHPTQCFGTPDWWRYDPIDRKLRVWDYKYGYLYVDPFENWQLIAYAVGLIDTLGLDDQATMLELGIVQPRSYRNGGPVQKWEPRASDLRAYANQAHNASHEALAPDPVAKTGPHCEFCPGRHECRTLQNAAMSAADFAGTMERVNLPAPAVATELHVLDAALRLLNARRDGLGEQAMSMIRRGERVPGFAVEHPEGRLAWNRPPDEVFMLGDLVGVELRKPAEPITPTQAKKKIDGAVIDGYSSRPRGAAKLVTDTTTQARKVFGANAT